MEVRNIQGTRIGRWLVLEETDKRTMSGGKFYRCICDCGTKRDVSRNSLVTGESLSCGCLRTDRITIHGMTNTKEFRTWQSMLNRCEKPRTPNYNNYGGRGIRVCGAWHDFSNFLKDMGRCPTHTARMSIERIDVNGDYEPSNCVWETPKVQGNNRRTNRYFVVDGKTYTASQLAGSMGFKDRHAILNRIRKGWSVEDAVNTPFCKRK